MDLRAWGWRRKPAVVGGLHAQTVSIRSAVDLFWSTANTDVQSTTYADLRGGAKGAMPPPNVAPTSSRRGYLAPLECKKTF